jgi:signal transduction histidine kinase
MVFQLRPAEIETEGLAAALRKHVELLRRAHRRRIGLELAGTSLRRPDIEEEVFRIAQESLNNALRHSRAEHVDVRLEESGRGLRLSVADDGVGFDPEEPGLRARRLGLTSMEERARALGGRLEITSAPGRGTRIDLEVDGGGDPRPDR